MSLEVGIKTKLNARLANISANKISLTQGQSYSEKEYYNGS